MSINGVVDKNLTILPKRKVLESSCPWKKISIIGLAAIGLMFPAFLISSDLFSGQQLKPADSISVFSSYTLDNPQRLEMSRIVADNQRQYCALHGYKYQVIEKNLAAPVLPYWSKIGGIIELLQSPEKPEWVVWLDDDAVVTNPSIELQRYILSHGGKNPNTHVIVTEDAMSGHSWCTDLNTGVLIVRNSKFSLKFFQALWEKRLETIFGESYTYGNCPDQPCLHDQQAMHDLLRLNPQYLQHVSIIPQRDAQGIGINVFRRFSHYDVSRDQELNYAYDPSHSRFHEGDFITQCTGLATNGMRSFPLGERIHRVLRYFRVTQPVLSVLNFLGITQSYNYRMECVQELIDFSRK